ncbi:MAG: NrfD/PsrC family molybdoenzyme membrane anchor subunit, partial [Dehalococcoidia bacterium]|nr:NrfD/PsrC family molybdoenzyme membrane anchor subunit [Dehalococcoidia bacterium]
MARGIGRPEHKLLRPILHSGRGFMLFTGLLLILAVWFGYAWFVQLRYGLGVSGMRTPVGAAWGLYITNFIFFVGMAHGGIAIAAAIKLLKLNTYKPVARIGELVTVVSLSMAGIAIIIDMGRPDRVFNVIRYWPERVVSSPLSWDITVVFTYFVLSLTFLWLSMRSDMAKIIDKVGGVPGRKLIYRLLLVGYTPEEDKKVDDLTWWLSLAVVFLIVMLSGGVVAWIFGLLPSRPGWFGALAGPYFLTAAIASAIGGVIVIAAVLRKVFDWKEYIGLEVFTGLGRFLGVITMFYLYLILAEQLTMRFAAPHSEKAVSDLLLKGELAIFYWPMLIGGFFIPSLFVVIQPFKKGRLSVPSIAIAAIFI